MTITVMDYEFSPRSEEHDVQQSEFVVSADDLKCPHLAFTPASVWERFHTFVGNSVQIQRGYRLTGQVAKSIDLPEDLIELLDGTVRIEVGERYLLRYRRGHLVSPTLTEYFVKEGISAYAVVVDALLVEHQS